MKKGIVDLCSGVGGFSLGAELAGFETVVAVDIDEDLQSSFPKNFPSANVVKADISQLDSSSWRDLLGGTGPAGVIGGPPCQGFSRIGKRAPNDPRNNMVGEFFRQVSLIGPDFFMMENVDGLLDEDNVDILMTGLEAVSSRYCILDPMVVNAMNYGAPTDRTRVVVFGYDPNEMNAPDFEGARSHMNATPVTVKDAIADLPSPMEAKPGKGAFDWIEYPTNMCKLSAYAKRCRALPPSNTGWSEAIRNLKLGRVSGFIPTAHTSPVVQRFSKTPQGKTEPISRYPRLSWIGQCPTLRAGTGKDRGSFQSMRPIHPEEPRVITVREAARLQGFPDWFVFHPTKWHSFRMIGNSVSPIVSQALLGAVMAATRAKLAA